MNKYRVRRLIAYFIIAIIVLLFTGKAEGTKEVIIESHIVTQGETLWSIAKQYKAESDYILDYMDDLKNLNKSSLETLQVGQVIKVIKEGGN